MKKIISCLLVIILLLWACDTASNPDGSGGGSGGSGSNPGTQDKPGKHLVNGLIVDHTSIDIYAIPQSAIVQAKEKLHIGYGHTSHGSQITTGMRGLVAFMNRKAGYPQDLFSVSTTGAGDTLHLFEGAGYGSGYLERDGGYHPTWINETNEYLGDPTAEGRGSNHPDINVIMWSWCGQVSSRTEANMLTTYLQPMSELEEKYPGIAFIYMTGHADGSGESGNLHQRNKQIRQYCIDNNKFLFDFYDIECYDPDGNYFGDKNVTDACNYDSTSDANANWAIEWQNSHTLDVDWYSCSSAHSQALNANMKAYAAWWLFASLAGWDGN